MDLTAIVYIDRACHILGTEKKLLEGLLFSVFSMTSFLVDITQALISRSSQYICVGSRARERID